MSVDWKKVRKELNAQKQRLFDRLVKSPGEVGLAIEIKKLDNGMLRCAEHLQHERSDQTKASLEKADTGGKPREGDKRDEG